MKIEFTNEEYKYLYTDNEYKIQILDNAPKSIREGLESRVKAFNKWVDEMNGDSK